MRGVKDRVAIVAGATSEVGEAVSLGLAAGQAKVVIADSNLSKVQSLVARITKAGGVALAAAADVVGGQGVKSVIVNTLGTYGRVDILVNNVDDPASEEIGDISEESWTEALKRNLGSALLFCHEVAPQMRDQQYGRIINVGSVDYLGWPGKASYSAARSGIFGLTRSLALELAKHNITVNYIAEGDLAGEKTTAEVAKNLAESLPIRRLPTSVDVAHAVAFLASDDATYITGQTLFVCSGKNVFFSMSA